MTGKEFKNLLPGDVVRLNKTGEGYVVTASSANKVLLVRSLEVLDPAIISFFDREKVWHRETESNPKKRKSRKIRID